MLSIDEIKGLDVENCPLTKEYRVRFLREFCSECQHDRVQYDERVLEAVLQAFDRGMQSGASMMFYILTHLNDSPGRNNVE